MPFAGWISAFIPGSRWRWWGGTGTAIDGASVPLSVAADFAGPALAYVRPHDVVLTSANDSRQAGISVHVRRVVPLGATVRVELAFRTGDVLEAQIERDTWRTLSLEKGDAAFAIPRAARVFPAR